MRYLSHQTFFLWVMDIKDCIHEFHKKQVLIMIVTANKVKLAN